VRLALLLHVLLFAGAAAAGPDAKLLA